MAVWRFPVTVTTLGGNKCNNTWHIRTGNLVTTDAAAVQSAANALRTWYSAQTLAFSTGTQVTADVAINVDDASDVPVSWTAVSGTGGTGQAPSVLAICTSWQTSSRTRRGRGRTFLGPLQQGPLQTDGTVVDSFLTTSRAANDALVSASLVDNDWAIAIWGLQSPAPKGYTGDYADLPHVARDIVGHRIRDTFAVLRSRRV